MKIQRVYPDTSVFGGCFDPEFETWSNALMRDFEDSKFQAVLSDVVAAEIEAAPLHVREAYGAVLVSSAEYIETPAQAFDLANIYIARGILGPASTRDALHIAVATVANVDIVVSWNFKHIVHFDKIRMFNAVNIEQGYHSVAIHTPREVTTYGRQENDQDNGNGASDTTTTPGVPQR